MRFEDWEPIYLRILSDMGYSQEEDERAARVLASTNTIKQAFTALDIDAFFRDQTVTIIGAAPGLEDVLQQCLPGGRIVAAGSATEFIMEAGIIPDMVVTDLDGDMRFQMKAFQKGAIPIVHAHGDNIPLIEKYVPQLGRPFLGTTQSSPFPPLQNWGGFTDGDRAVCMAAHHRARICLLGFDFQNPRGNSSEERAVKQCKLKWAESIIQLCMD
jgi:uncharacterized Rossmann fold enzyme